MQGTLAGVGEVSLLRDTSLELCRTTAPACVPAPLFTGTVAGLGLLSHLGLFLG